MSRHAHTVRVLPGASVSVRLVCSCGWESPLIGRPSVSALSEQAREHRRAAAEQASDGRCTYHWATERCPMPAEHKGRHVFAPASGPGAAQSTAATRRHHRDGERP